MMEFVNGKDAMPYIMENKSNVWNHQPDHLLCGLNTPSLGPTFSKRTVLRIFLDVPWSNIGLTFR